MSAVCGELKPSTCLECVAGETTGEMLEYMSFKSTLILYGLLSDKPAGGIRVISFIGKVQAIEGFLLAPYLAKKTKDEYFELVKHAQSLYSTMLSTQIQKKFGLHEITDAIQYYLRNQTQGKIVIDPKLTSNDQGPSGPVIVNSLVPKL